MGIKSADILSDALCPLNGVKESCHNNAYVKQHVQYKARLESPKIQWFGFILTKKSCVPFTEGLTVHVILYNVLIITEKYSETCLNQTLNKPESCINLSKPNPQ